MRARVAALGATILLAAAVLLPATLAAAPAVPSDEVDNPCRGPERQQLLCPNLRIGTPSELYVQDLGGGRVLLHATSDVRSRGHGPMELHGERDGPRSMRVNQRIYRVGGGHVDLRTGASLHFTDVGSYWGGSYWKVHQLAHFELRRIEPDGTPGPVVRVGPKLNYCLRDLERTQPGPSSPPSRHYPGCNQDPYIHRDTLGTSVGWSDIYPADYDNQWIQVGGLRGCFAFVMTVDPQHLLFESNENDNSSARRVRLPFTGAGC